MSTRYHNGQTVEGGAVPYRIEGGVASVGRFAVSYAARKPDGTRVFLKQYKAPTRLEPWYRDYIAHQKELKRRIESDPTLASRTYEFADMFEARDAFIQVFGFIEDGRDLRSWLDGGIPSPRLRWEFAEAFVSALARFHGAGIVHTDLKPENVYLMPGALGSGWNVKLIDFDFTVLSGREAPWRGQDGFEGWVGTRRYMSPEHLAGEVPEARSDVFTASLILHELLAAAGHPYPADDAGYLATMREGPPPPPRLFAPDTPETAALAREMAGALSPEVTGRPSAEGLLAVLRGARETFRQAQASSAIVPTARPHAEEMDVPSGALALVGKEGKMVLRLDAAFGQRTLVPLVGEEGARFAEVEQFCVGRNAGTGAWWVASARDNLRNPPMLDDAALGTEPQPLRDGATIHVASSRKDPAVRKGELRVRVG